jgi:hypothetical protein
MDSPEKKVERGADHLAKDIVKAMCALGRCPEWRIFRDGAGDSIRWVENPANLRFAIHASQGGASQPQGSEGVVLDKETGLIWARNANLLGMRNWLDANTLCRELELVNRMGWRLPTVEELSSLVDPRQAPLALPHGHPFLNVQHGSGVAAYWTASNAENPAGAAWFVNLWRGASPHLAGLGNKAIPGNVWPVRGGSSGINWNW